MQSSALRIVSLTVILVLACLIQTTPTTDHRMGISMKAPVGLQAKWKNEKRLIKTSSDKPAKWMSIDQVKQLQRKQIHFMDVTFTGEQEISINSFGSVPTVPTQQNIAKTFAERASTDLLRSVLTEYSNRFYTRYYESENGEVAGDWLFEQIQNLIEVNNVNDLPVSASQYHHAWRQKSIIVRIEGSQAPSDVVILGGHLDSINSDDETLRAPGADDDGSGTVTVMETLRVLLKYGYRPLRTVEFHWYSAEEGGLLGSQDIAKYYRSKNINVLGMMQLDMTGYKQKAVPIVGVVTDFVDNDLSKLLSNIVPVATGFKTSQYKCGYACSDHASWYKNGYRSTRPCETETRGQYPYIHTENDTVDKVNFDYMVNFVKIAIGFLVELSNQI